MVATAPSSKRTSRSGPSRTVSEREQRAEVVRFRRALTLVGLSVVAPGSAQLVAGNRRVGKSVLFFWACMVAVCGLVLWLVPMDDVARLAGLLPEPAGGEHDGRIRGVRAARDRGDHDRAVADDAVVERDRLLGPRFHGLVDIDPDVRVPALLEQPTDLVVRIHHLAGISAWRRAPKRLRRRVRIVRVVEVDPQIERTRAALRLLQPGHRGIDDGRGWTLDVNQAAMFQAAIIERIVVDLMALPDAPARVQHVRRDEPGRRIAAGEKTLGERGRGRLEHEAVVANRVPRRIQAGEQRRMRW